MASNPNQLGSIIAAMMAQSQGAPQGPSPQARQYRMTRAEGQDRALNERTLAIADSIFSVSGANEFLEELGGLFKKYADTPFVKGLGGGLQMVGYAGPGGLAGAARGGAATQASDIAASEAGLTGAMSFTGGYNDAYTAFQRGIPLDSIPSDQRRSGPYLDATMATAQKADALRTARTTKNDVRQNAVRLERTQDKSEIVKRNNKLERANSTGKLVGGEMLGRLFAAFSSRLTP